MLTLAWWKAAAERAAKTAGQSALLVFGADQVNALHANWRDVAGFALGGLVLSLLTSVASSRVAGDGPSLTTEHVAPSPLHPVP